LTLYWTIMPRFSRCDGSTTLRIIFVVIVVIEQSAGATWGLMQSSACNRAWCNDRQQQREGGRWLARIQQERGEEGSRETSISLYARWCLFMRGSNYMYISSASEPLTCNFRFPQAILQAGMRWQDVTLSQAQAREGGISVLSLQVPRSASWILSDHKV
jgi:hypothetical protein